MKLEASDPRLTAYVLGELSDREVADIEAAIAEDVELRAAVDETRRTAALIADVFGLEPALELTEEAREALQSRPSRDPLPFRVVRRARAWSAYQKLAAVVVIALGLWATVDFFGPYVAFGVAVLDAMQVSSSHDSANRDVMDTDVSDRMFAQSKIHGALRALSGGGDDLMAASLAPGYLGSDGSTGQLPAGAVAIATPGLPLDLALTAEPMWMRLQPTAQPPPPVTGGGPAVGGGDASAYDVADDLDLPPSASGAAARMIIKNADMSLLVDSVARALSRVDAIAAESGGYVTETRTEVRTQGDDRAEIPDYAVIGISVPVERFESALTRLREIGVVQGESTSGSDVTQEYVDVQSQLANLEATQARVREFLDQAATVEEALRVNAELTQIEGQIGQLKGRLQYLSGRAAFSTITVEMHEVVPEVSATPTLTPTPTPTPTPSWNPVRTAEHATGTLVGIGKSVITLAIWLLVVWLPVVLGVGLVVWGVRAGLRWAKRHVGG